MSSKRTTWNTGVVFWMLCLVLLSASSLFAQSTDQAFPTAVTENQVSGRIRARDVGDPRVTTYFYTFNGRQGDVFVNVVTKNLTGSIDIFATEGLRPLTKIIVYADLAHSETGRVLYLRKPERLILRVEGRTPNDDPAEFLIKFAGSFEAAIPSTDEPPVPKVSDAALATDSGIRVNSVGTIVEVIPKPKPTPKPDAEAAETPSEKAVTRSVEDNKLESADKKEETANKVTEEPAEQQKPAAEEINPTTKEEPPKTTPRRATTAASRRNRARTPAPVKTDQAPDTKPTEEIEKTPQADEQAPKVTGAPEVVVTENMPAAKPNPLANVNLVIVFKDGRRVERPMLEVFRFTADQTTLTVVSKTGRVAKYPILDVASVTIQ